MTSELRDKYDSDEQFNDAITYSRNTRAENARDAILFLKSNNFEVNDILIKRYKEYDWREGSVKWFTEKFSPSNDSNRKYKIVHVDEAGIPYMCKLKFNGNLSSEVTCLAGFDPNCVVFEHDPDFLDHQLLADEDEDFDPQVIYREKRDERNKTRPRKTQ